MERERLAALGEAAGVMAHEVRNPVGSIMNALALLKRQGHGSPSDEALLSIISEETARLEHLVTQLLDAGLASTRWTIAIPQPNDAAWL